MGVIADSGTPDVFSEEVHRQLEKLGTSSVVTPAGWLGFSFVFFLLAVSLFCAGQVASLRGEEADQRLETLLALPLGRNAWLTGRLLLASAAATLVALAAGVLAWAGAAAKGADVSLAGMLGAGANTLPPASPSSRSTRSPSRSSRDGDRPLSPPRPRRCVRAGVRPAGAAAR